MHANWHFPADETAAEMQHKNIINTFALRRVKKLWKTEDTAPMHPHAASKCSYMQKSNNMKANIEKTMEKYMFVSRMQLESINHLRNNAQQKWNMMVYWGIMRLHSRQLMHLNVRNVLLSNWHFPASGAAAELLQKMEETNRNYSTLLPPHVSHISP